MIWNKIQIVLGLLAEFMVIIIAALFIFAFTAMIFGGLSFLEPLVTK